MLGGLLAVTQYAPFNSQQIVSLDGNGNVFALVDSSTGIVCGQYEYSPFGEIIRSTGVLSKANPFRFSTKFQDNETELVYYGYRYYNPTLGRWLTKDPAQEIDGPALYVTLQNNLQTSYDYLGLWLNVLGGCASDKQKQLLKDEEKYAIDVLTAMSKQFDDEIGTSDKFKSKYPKLFAVTQKGKAEGFDPDAFYLTYYTKMQSGIKSIIKKINENSTTAHICCSTTDCPYCTKNENEDSTVMAYTSCKDTHIYFCPGFLDLGTTLQVGIIVHEYSHLVLCTKDKPTPEQPYPMQWPHWPEWSYYWQALVQEGIPKKLGFDFGTMLPAVAGGYGYIQ